MKHFLIYYKVGTGTVIVTEPRPWARENQNHFPDFDFQNAQVGNHPTTNQVEIFLIENFGFQVYEADNIRVLYNFNPQLGI